MGTVLLCYGGPTGMQEPLSLSVSLRKEGGVSARVYVVEESLLGARWRSIFPLLDEPLAIHAVLTTFDT